MATATSMGDITQYFDSKVLSDVVVSFDTPYGNCGINAHKIVLAKASEFFNTAFTGEFKESKSAEINLHDDDRFAVIGMLADCYGLVFDGRSEYSKEGVTIDCNDNGAGFVQYKVNLYVVADKYGVANLCTQIKERFPDMLVCITSTSVKEYPAYLDQVARSIYIDNQVAAKDLRAPLINTLVKHVQSCVSTKEFEALIMDVPELAVELFRALAGNTGGETGSKAGPGNVGTKRPRKRKLQCEVDDLIASTFQR